MTNSDDINPEQKQRFPMNRRAGVERRSDLERRIQNLGSADGKERRKGLERRSKLDRRSGVDRRLLNQELSDQADRSEQYISEMSLTEESSGLFSRVTSAIRRWFSR